MFKKKGVLALIALLALSACGQPQSKIEGNSILTQEVDATDQGKYKRKIYRCPKSPAIIWGRRT